MIYFVTGASGFIGKRLMRKLLARADATVYFLVRNPAADRLDALRRFWGADAHRAIAVAGDLTTPGLSVASDDLNALDAVVDHVFHLGAIYALDADPEKEMTTNVEGTRNAVRFAEQIRAKRFHHVSSIAAAGLYEGVFREDMFEEAENLAHPYFASKHESEKVVRNECTLPWRIYRPGIVVGDSRDGEMDKIDGPYYFFKLIQKMRRLLPPWMPNIGLEGGRINLVPVNFVACALDHLAHLDGQDGCCFHLTDPHPRRVGDILNIFARAAHAPDMTIRINAALLNIVPRGVLRSLMALTPIRRIRKAIMNDLGLPDDILTFVNYPTRFDCRDAQRLLAPAGISVPPLEDYAWRLWDYWERHLDPDLFVDRSLWAASPAESCSSPADRRGSAWQLRSSLRRLAVLPSLRRAIPRSLRPLNRKRTAAGCGSSLAWRTLLIRRSATRSSGGSMRNTAASTFSSTMPADRSVAGSKARSTGCMISNAPCRSTISALSSSPWRCYPGWSGSAAAM